jgi:hypothetical protein
MVGVSGVAAAPRRAAQSVCRANSCRRLSSGSRISIHDLASARALGAVSNDNAVNDNNNDVDNNGVHSRHCATERRAFGAMIEREDARVH